MTHLNDALRILERIEHFDRNLSYLDLQTVLKASHSTREIYQHMPSDRVYLREVITKMEKEAKGAKDQVIQIISFKYCIQIISFIVT